MGSTNFSNLYLAGEGQPVATAQEAYKTLCTEARMEYGHDPYNGTIATTDGVRVVQSTPVTRDEAHKIESERCDDLNKWDLCEAVALVEESFDEWETTRQETVEMTFSGADWRDPEKVRASIAKVLKVKPEQVEAWNARGDSTNAYRPRVQVEAKVEAKAPKEKTETRFFVIPSSHAKMPAWEHGYPSQSKAREALPSSLRYGPGEAVEAVNVEIISMTRRVTGEPLVQATVSAKTVTATLNVSLRTLVKKGKVGTKQVGWLFYGWAAC